MQDSKGTLKRVGTSDSPQSESSIHQNEDDEARGIKFLEDPQTANEEEVTKLRNRRKNARKRYWDNVLNIVQESERPQQVLQQGDMPQEKIVDSGDPYNLAEFTPSSFQEWLAKAKQTLPSNAGDLGKYGRVLQGKYYRILRRAGTLIFAKCAFTDEDQDYDDDDEEHLKEAGSPEQGEYRKSFNYFDHLETIKSFPTSIRKKRKMYRYLNSEAELFSEMKEFSSTVRLHSWLYTVKTTAQTVYQLSVPLLHIWKVPIRNINAYFGVEVYLSFVWFRSFYILQLACAISAAILLTLPEFLLTRSTTKCMANQTLDFSGSDIFFGDGSLYSVCFYYGGYQNNLDPLSATLIKITYYRWSIFWVLIFAFHAMVLLIRVAKAKRFAHSSGKYTLVYFNEVFCVWEFSLNSVTQKKIMQTAIARFLTRHLQQGKGRNVYLQTSGELLKILNRRLGRNGMVIFHWLVNVVVLFIAILTGFLTHLLTTKSCDLQDKLYQRFKFPDQGLKIDYDTGPFPGIYISFVLNIVNPFIAFMSDLEIWGGLRARNYAVLSRITVVLMANYAAILSFWWLDDVDVYTCKRECEESVMAATTYILFMWEFIATVTYWIIRDIFINLFRIFRKKLRRKYTYEPPEPVMDCFFTSAVFLQSILILALPCGPLLSVLLAVLTALKFYIKKAILFCIYIYPRMHLHKIDYQMPYCLCYGIMFLTSTFGTLHWFTKKQPSTDCGPWMRTNVTSSYLLLFFTDFADNTKATVEKVLWAAADSPAGGYALLGLIIGTIAIIQSWGNAYLSTVEVHKDLLALERKDRNYLLRAIYNLMESQGKTTDFGLVLDKDNIFKAKIRWLATLIVGGKRYALSQQYQQILQQRRKLQRKLEATENTTDEVLKNRRKAMEQELQSNVLTPPVETIEARRQSLAQKFLLHAEAIRLAHTAARRERQRQWATGEHAKSKILQHTHSHHIHPEEHEHDSRYHNYEHEKHHQHHL